MQTTHRPTRYRELQADAAQALFIEFGLPSFSLISAANNGASMVAECGRHRQAAFIKQAQDADQIHTIGNDGTLADIERQCGVPQRDSAEADAALKLFIEHGFSAAFLINMACRPLVDTRVFPIRPSQMPRWDFASCGGGKTAMLIGSLVHNGVYELLRADKTHQLKEQELVARAAYNLGELSARVTTAEERKERKSFIKRELVQNLVNAGVRMTDVQIIMNNMLKGLRHV